MAIMVEKEVFNIYDSRHIDDKIEDGDQDDGGEEEQLRRRPDRSPVKCFCERKVCLPLILGHGAGRRVEDGHITMGRRRWRRREVSWICKRRL